jgi:hypothetical protein
VREPIWKFSVHSARGAFVGNRFDEEDMHASLRVQLSKRAPTLGIWSQKSCVEPTSAQGLEPTE